MKIQSLGEVVECLDRLRVPVKESERPTGNVPYYGANGQQGWIDRAIFDEPLIIVAEDGGHFDEPSRGVAYRISGPAWVNNHGHVLRPKDEVNLNYLFHALRNYDFTPYISGSTRSKLTQRQMLRAEIALPAESEQRRISTVLDLADAVVAKHQQVEVLLRDLTESVFSEMFGHFHPERSLLDISTKITDGTHQSPHWQDSGIPFLFISNIISGEIDLDTKKFISESTYNELTRRTSIEVGDILYTTVGSYGVPAVVRKNHRFAFQRHIAHIKPTSGLIMSDFLAAQLASPPLVRQAARAARGVAQPTVNLGDIKRFKIFVPPMEQQQEFVQRTASIRSLRGNCRQSLNECRVLSASLRALAFRGEL